MDQSPVPEGEAPEAPAAAPSQPPAPPPSDSGEITIRRVRLRNGRLTYEDRSVAPAVALALTRINGTIAGLSSKELARADVDINARLENVAEVKLYGKINPLIENQYTDLTLEAKGADLMPMGPYCGKYLGYALQKGKLDLAMKYLVSSRNLQASNLITIDQLTLGEKVESPDATGLPVKLGVALLKDRNGVIELDVPVEGSLDDPKFRLGRVIMHAIGVVFTKLVTSPFKLLARAFGGSRGGPELSGVRSGSRRADAPGAGEAEPSGHLALREARSLPGDPWCRGGRGRSRRAQAQEAGGSPAPREMGVAGQERARRHAAGVGDRRRRGNPGPGEAGLQDRLVEGDGGAGAGGRGGSGDGRKPEAPEEMEDWLLARLDVTDDDLRQLAARRAAAVRDYILATGKVEPERLFLSDEKPADTAEGRRVTLALN